MTKQHTSASDSPAPQGDGAPKIEITTAMVEAGVRYMEASLDTGYHINDRNIRGLLRAILSGRAKFLGG